MKKVLTFLLFATVFSLAIINYMTHKEQPALVSVWLLSPARYEIVSCKLVGDSYHCLVKDVKTSKAYLVDLGIGPPSPPETPGTQFTTGNGTYKFDVKTEGIPPETTNLYVINPNEKILKDIPDGDYELLEVTHEGYASPDRKSTYYVYKLKDLKTSKVVLTEFIYPTGFLEKTGTKFRFKRLPNGGSTSEPLP